MTITNKHVLIGSMVSSAVFTILFVGVAAQALSSTLSPGTTGSHVSELQTFLATDSSIYPEGLVTGFYGELTTAAVQRFQCKYGIVCAGDPDSTGYGRVGPRTLAAINGVVTPGAPNTGAPSADNVAPIMTREIVTVGSTTAAITWNTNEPSNNSVLYASVWPFYLGTAPSALSSSFSSNAVVTLTNLVPNHTYYYVRQSVDSSGNVQYGFGGSFKTGQ